MGLLDIIARLLQIRIDTGKEIIYRNPLVSCNKKSIFAFRIIIGSSVFIIIKTRWWKYNQY